MPRSIIRKGKDDIAPAGGGKFIKLKDGDSVAIAPLVGLDEMISCDQHEFWDTNPAVIFPCIQTKCPGCEREDKPKFKAFLPVLTKEDGVKVFSFGIKVYRQLEDLEAELGTIKGKQLKVRRSGTGRTTSYTVVGTGKVVKVEGEEIPDIITMLGPTTREDILKLMEQRGLDTSSSSETTPPWDEGKSEKKSDDWEDL